MLDSLRPHVQTLLHPIVEAFDFLGLTPNSLSILSFSSAVLSGILFFHSKYHHFLLLLAGFFVFLNALFDAADGALAREKNTADSKGDFLDHVLDRYSDIFIVCGIFFGGYAPWEIGVLAVTGVIMSSYLGTQAQAVGIGRYYGGVFGRADRLIILIFACPLNFFYPDPVFGFTILGWVLIILGIGGHFTAVQRFFYVWKRL
ncbi:MAG: CDP-alcohol phosphatidyltransferase family protein [Candidatus Syntropharchaeia archaeon]